MPGNNAGPSQPGKYRLAIGRLGSEGFWMRDYEGCLGRSPFWRPLIGPVSGLNPAP